MLNFNAVLFDFDGVLGNTMQDNYQAWVYALGLHSASLSKLEYFLWEGQRVSFIASEILKRHGQDPQLGPEVARLKDEYYNQHNNFSFHAGAEELVAILKKQKKKVAVVSGASRLRLINSKTESFLNSFDAIVCADDCQKGKPDPEPYLKAAEKLSVPAEHCIVIENAPSGIDSAKSAGMYCIAVCSTLTPQYLSKADKIVNELKELLSDPLFC